MEQKQKINNDKELAQSEPASHCRNQNEIKLKFQDDKSHEELVAVPYSTPFRL